MNLKQKKFALLRRVLAVLVACTVILCAVAYNWHVTSFDQITMEREACLERCPIYRLIISGDGKVDYGGTITRFVKTLGRASATLSQKQISELVTAINDAHYLFMSKFDFSGHCATDQPTVKTSVVVNGTVYKIEHNLGTCSPGNQMLMRFEDEIDRIVNSEQWIGSPKEREQIEHSAPPHYNL